LAVAWPDFTPGHPAWQFNQAGRQGWNNADQCQQQDDE
jgi:hypothetical protein